MINKLFRLDEEELKIINEVQELYQFSSEAETVRYIIRQLLMLSWDVMIPLCHADMKLPGYLSWNVPFDGAVIRPITEGISSYIHALPAL